MDCDNNAPTDSCLDPENREMFAISYVIIFAFRPELNFDRIIIERSFGYNLTKTHKFRLFDFLLRDCVIRVSKQKSKVAISEMFTTELKFCTDCLVK